MIRFTGVRLACLGLTWFVASCASAPPTKPEPANLLTDRSCHFVGIESAQGPNDTDSDSVALLAAYRFSEPGDRKNEQPLSLKFQVSRSRAEELEQYLTTRSDVICSPDAELHYSARVEPFEGIRGVPQQP